MDYWEQKDRKTQLADLNKRKRKNYQDGGPVEGHQYTSQELAMIRKTAAARKGLLDPEETVALAEGVNQKESLDDIKS